MQLHLTVGLKKCSERLKNLCQVTQRQSQYSNSVLMQSWFLVVVFSPTAPSLEGAMSITPQGLLLVTPGRSLRKDCRNCTQQRRAEAGTCRKHMEVSASKKTSENGPRRLEQTELLLHYCRVGPFQLPLPAQKQSGSKQGLSQSQVIQRHN